MIRNDILCLISRGKSRFVDAVHVPNAELRSSAELLTELQKSEGGESCLGQSNTSNQETGAAHVSSHTSNEENCAKLSAFLPAKRPSSHKEPTEKVEGYSCQFFVWRSSVYRSPRWLQEWCVITIKTIDNLTQLFTGTTTRQVLLKAFAKHGARDFSEKHCLQVVHEGSSKSRIEYCEDFPQ